MSAVAAGGRSGMETIDLGPATAALAGLVRGVRDDQLTDPTPCPAYTVADLVDHVGGLAVAFRVAATGEALPGATDRPRVDGRRLEPGFRDRIATDLDALATAWTDPAAYVGTTRAGGVDLPAEVAALVALDEVVVHGWDLARSTGQAHDPGEAAVLAALAFASTFEVPAGVPEGGGPFGPAVAVPADAPAIDRLAGATGRDPAWRP